MTDTWMNVCVGSSLFIIGMIIGYVTHVMIQKDISEFNQDQVDTFQDEITSNQSPPFIEGGNSEHGTTKEYNENEVRFTPQ